MLSIHHGPPGSFKSFSVVQNILIPALLGYDPNKSKSFLSKFFNKKESSIQGRVVVTNMRGFSVESIESALGLKIHPNSELITVPMTENGFDRLSKFWHWVPRNALIVIDEVPEVYPKSWTEKNFEKIEYPDYVADDESSRPRTVKGAFNMSRHFGWDIVMTATNIDKLHPLIKLNCEFAVRHKNLTGLFPWLKNTWKEVKHNSAVSGLAVSSHMEQPTHNKANAKYFKAYRSTVSDDPKNSHGNSNLLLQPKLVIFYVVILLSIALFSILLPSSRLFSSPQTSKAPPKVIKETNVFSVSPDNRKPYSQVDSPVASGKLGLLEKIFENKLYNVGNFGSIYFFVDTDGQTFTNALFKQLGAKFEVLSNKQLNEPLTHLFKISFSDKEYIITRDYRQHRNVDYEYVYNNDNSNDSLPSSNSDIDIDLNPLSYSTR